MIRQRAAPDIGGLLTGGLRFRTLMACAAIKPCTVTEAGGPQFAAAHGDPG